VQVLYIAKHNSGGNDDEGAITHALQELGHEVITVSEGSGSDALGIDADLCLFHKWDDVAILNQLKMPKAFWYFDLVDWDDSSLRARNRTRLRWMKNIIPHVDRGFCTDGDWINRYQEEAGGKLVRLSQGADERFVGMRTGDERFDLLFTGITRGGRERRRWVVDMANRYGKRFVHYQRGIYRGKLQKYIAQTTTCLGPSSPVTDRYWSNRVYMYLGFGAFMIHRHSEGLAEHYEIGKELITYKTMDELCEKIDYYHAQPEERKRVKVAALARTQGEHLYRHRCETLLEEMRATT